MVSFYRVWFWYGYRELPPLPLEAAPHGSVTIVVNQDLTPQQAMWEVLETCNIARPCLLATSLCDQHYRPVGPVSYSLSSALSAALFLSVSSGGGEYASL